MSSHNIIAAPAQKRMSRRSPATLTARSGSNSTQPSSGTKKAGTSHRADIQGLRAVAVLLVVLAHAGVGFMAGGFVGVDIFFVLSGFLITGLLLAEARDRSSVSLLDFYVRRARRILPAAALTLLATNVAALYLLNFVRGRAAVIDDLHAAAFAANFRFAAHGVDYFARADPPSPVLHFWSLAVEEQFYLVWPLLLSIALFGFAVRGRERRHRHERRLLAVVVVLAGASLCWSVHLTATQPTAAYFSPFTRAWELGLGATIAICATTLGRVPVRARLVMGWAGILAIAVAAVIFSGGTPFPGLAALLPTIGTALAIVAGMGDRLPRFGVTWMLGLRPMRVIGDRSYALYLWHWPVLIVAVAYAGRELSVLVKLVLVACAFGLSCVSYGLVENPIRRRMRSRVATVVVVAVFMTAVLSTAAVSLAAINREAGRFEAPLAGPTPLAPALTATERARGALPAVVAAVEAARRGDPIPTGLTPPIGQLRNFPPPYALPAGCIGQDSRPGTATKICRAGQTSSRKLIVLIGDSHAMMWLPALLEMSWRDGWAVVPLLRLGCNPNTWGPDGRKTCREWFRWAVRQAGQLHPRVTLLAGSIDDRPTPTARVATRRVIEAARELKRFGPVAVIGDPEAQDQDPVDCLLSGAASMKRCTTTWPPASLAGYDDVARRSKQLGVGFLATRGFVCYQRQCPAVIGHTIAWMDNNHLTVTYSAELVAPFRLAFLRAIRRR